MTQSNWDVQLACDRLVCAVRRMQNEPSLETAKGVVDLCHEIQSNAFDVAILKSKRWTGAAVQLTNKKWKWDKSTPHSCIDQPNLPCTNPLCDKHGNGPATSTAIASLVYEGKLSAEIANKILQRALEMVDQPEPPDPEEGEEQPTECQPT